MRLQGIQSRIGLVWILAVVILFAQLGSGPLTDIDEGAFSEATREMLARGDPVSPWLLDAPRFDKPALIHWLQMVSMSVFGITTLGARIPSAMAGLIWIGTIAGMAFLASRKILPNQDPREAYFWGLVIAVTTIGIPAMSRVATADATLNALLSASLLCIWLHFYGVTAQRHQQMVAGKTWGRIAAVCIGLGLLTKGPVAVLIPGVASIVGALSGALSGELRATFLRWFKLIADPISWLLVIVICAPWYWLQYQAQGMPFIEGFFGVHNIGRFTSTMHGFTAGPWYYPTWIAIAALPWLPLVARAVLSGFGSRLFFQKELAMFWGVFAFVLVFFSFSATKLPHYGFYGLSGLIVVMAIAITKKSAALPADVAKSTSESVRQSALWFDRAFIAALLVGLAALPYGWGWLAPSIKDVYYRTVWDAAAKGFADQVLWFVLPLAVAIYVFIAKPARGLWVGAAAFAITLHVMVVPTVIHALRDPILEAGTLIRKGSFDRVITWRLAAPSLSFHAQRVIKGAEPTTGDVVVMHTKDQDALKEHLLSQRPSERRNESLANKEAFDGIEVLWAKDGIQMVRIK